MVSLCSYRTYFQIHHSLDAACSDNDVYTNAQTCKMLPSILRCNPPSGYIMTKPAVACTFCNKTGIERNSRTVNIASLAAMTSA